MLCLLLCAGRWMGLTGSKVNTKSADAPLDGAGNVAQTRDANQGPVKMLAVLNAAAQLELMLRPAGRQ